MVTGCNDRLEVEKKTYLADNVDQHGKNDMRIRTYA